MRAELTGTYCFVYRKKHAGAGNALQTKKQKERKREMKKKILAAIVAIGAMGILSGCGTTKIDLSNYVKVEFEGIDGNGYLASYEIDKDKLEDDIKDANDDLSKKDRKRLIDSIELELKKDATGLSNGDKIKFKLDWSDRKAEKYGFEFSGDEKEVTVKGLKELKKIDAFKDIELTYSGTSPYLRISVENNSKNEFLKKCYYDVEYKNANSSYAKIGDEVTITVNYSDYDAEKTGYTVKEDSKKVKVEAKDVDAYVEKGSDIPAEELAEMKQKAMEYVEDRMFGDGNVYTYRRMMEELFNLEYTYEFDYSSVSRSGGEGNSSFKDDGLLLYVCKDTDEYSYSNYNYAVVIMEQQLQDSVCTSPVTVYFAVAYRDVILQSDGTIDYEDDYAAASTYAGSLDEIKEYFNDELDDDYKLEEVK